MGPRSLEDKEFLVVRERCTKIDVEILLIVLNKWVNYTEILNLLLFTKVYSNIAVIPIKNITSNPIAR